MTINGIENECCMRTSKGTAGVVILGCLISGCSGSSNEAPREISRSLEQNLIESIDRSTLGEGRDFYILPDSDDYSSIPQDPGNPITMEKVVLGKMIFHDTGFALNGVASDGFQSWSCSTCHHAQAGFKSGVLQGIGEGGAGFGVDGSARFLMPGFDANAEDGALNKPDLQPLTSPAALNAAYQEVMLWNGQFGNMSGGVVNNALPANVLTPEKTPVANNSRKLAGLEIQAIAGAGVHRLKLETDSPLQTEPEYQQLWRAAYPNGSEDILQDAGNAIAAFERTILANRAPFQRWLRGEASLSDAQMRGASLFFDKAGCVGCHTGPALSSAPGVSGDQVFAAIGLNDFATTEAAFAGTVDEKTSFGRGGFTGDEKDRYQFKIPQLYNLADTRFLGHGGSIRSVRDMVVYKNQALAQKTETVDYLDSRFTPLGLTDEEVDDLTEFLQTALYDPDLMRYQPAKVPSNQCVVVDPIIRVDPAFQDLCNGQSNTQP